MLSVSSLTVLTRLNLSAFNVHNKQNHANMKDEESRAILLVKLFALANLYFA